MLHRGKLHGQFSHAYYSSPSSLACRGGGVVTSMHRKRGRMRRTRKKKALIDIESSGIRIEFMDISFIEKVI